MGQRMLSEEQASEIASRYEAGETTRELADAFGCSVQPIFRVLREAGVTTRTGGAQAGAPSLHRRFTPEQDQEIAAEYQTGTSIRVIAEKRGASPAAVHGALKRTGTLRRDGHPNTLFTAEQDEQIAAEYLGGKRLEAIAHERGCSTEAVRAALKRKDVPTRRAGYEKRVFSASDIAEMAGRYEAGESQETIAAHFKVSQNTVSRMLRNNGVKTRMWAKGPEAHGSWKGGRVKSGDGYFAVWVAPDDPLACMRFSTGYVLEHRLVMARSLGRPLTPTETVHHKNGKRDDNRLENLQLRAGKHGKGSVLCCADCGSRNIVPVDLD